MWYLVLLVCHTVDSFPLLFNDHLSETWHTHTQYTHTKAMDKLIRNYCFPRHTSWLYISRIPWYYSRGTKFLCWTNFCNRARYLQEYCLCHLGMGTKSPTWTLAGWDTANHGGLVCHQPKPSPHLLLAMLGMYCADFFLGVGEQIYIWWDLSHPNASTSPTLKWNVFTDHSDISQTTYGRQNSQDFWQKYQVVSNPNRQPSYSRPPSIPKHRHVCTHHNGKQKCAAAGPQSGSAAATDAVVSPQVLVWPWKCFWAKFINCRLVLEEEETKFGVNDLRHVS